MEGRKGQKGRRGQRDACLRPLGPFCPLGLFIVYLAMCGVARADNWPQWRGPQGSGVSKESQLPLVWNEKRGVLWKATLPGTGASTPAIWEDAVFVTSDDDKGRLLLQRIDRTSGDTLWTQVVGEGQAVRTAPPRSKQKFHPLHNLASPSPVTDGKRVVAHFGNGDLACYDFAGVQIWKRNLQKDYGDYTIWWGHANSPVVIGNAVISVCMQDSLEDVQASPVESYIVAHDLRDGHERWKTTRKTSAQAEAGDAYTTPVVVEFEGKRQVIVSGGNQIDAYDPITGKQLWYFSGLNGGRTVTGPTHEDGLVFATAGMKNELVALSLGKTGQLNHRDVLWRLGQGTPDTCTPVAWNRLLFMVTDDGIARCCDALTGQFKWRGRLKGEYKASPIAAGGRIYFLNTTGLCTIVSATPKYDRIIENQLDDETIASPVISDGKIFIRGKKVLYCIGSR
jgi:outer membrane protein assembly factor BamB